MDETPKHNQDEPEKPGKTEIHKQEELEHHEKNTGNNRKIIIGLVIVLITVVGIQFYFNRKSEQSLQETITEKSEEVDMMVAKMDSMTVEIDEKIKTIEELGGDVEELKKVKEELEAERDQLKKQSNIAWASYRKVQDKVDGYATLLKEKDKEIEELKALNEELYSENTTLKTEREELSDSITNLSSEREELAGKVQVASRLKAENIVVKAINAKGKERIGEFKVKQIKDIGVDFNLAENSIAPIESKVIMIRIIDPDGNVIFDVSNGSGSFMLDGKEEFYTSRQEILFDNSRQRLTFLYDKGSAYAKGKHYVEIYAEDYTIGKGEFTVK